MTSDNEVVFLFDVDNTLLDNDRVTTDLRRYLEKRFGPELRDRYFSIFEELRAELGYAPQRSFEAGLAETVQWYRDNRAWWEPLKDR